MSGQTRQRVQDDTSIAITDVGGLGNPPSGPVSQPVTAAGTYSVEISDDIPDPNSLYVLCVINHPNGNSYDNGPEGPVSDDMWTYNFCETIVPPTDKGQFAVLTATLTDRDGNPQCPADSTNIQILGGC